MTALAVTGPQPFALTPARVLSLADETEDTFTMHLDAPGVRFAPGQFNMLYAFGVGEVPISVSGDPAEPAPLVHTIRVVGTVTRAIRAVPPGGSVGVRGPYGRPWPVDEARGGDLLLVAGGLGLAPLRPALYHALRHRSDYGRVCLLYGTRTPAGRIYAAELARWRADPRLQLLETVDNAGPDWKGHVGVVPALLRAAAFDPARATAFVCGPEVMMRFTVRELERRGVPEDRVHVSLERNMKCAIGFCGHCQLGPSFVCKDGPVLRYDRVRSMLTVREL